MRAKSPLLNKELFQILILMAHAPLCAQFRAWGPVTKNSAFFEDCNIRHTDGTQEIVQPNVLSRKKVKYTFLVVTIYRNYIFLP